MLPKESQDLVRPLHVTEYVGPKIVQFSVTHRIDQQQDPVLEKLARNGSQVRRPLYILRRRSLSFEDITIIEHVPCLLRRLPHPTPISRGYDFPRVTIEPESLTAEGKARGGFPRIHTIHDT